MDKVCLFLILGGKGENARAFVKRELEPSHTCLVSHEAPSDMPAFQSIPWRFPRLIKLPLDHTISINITADVSTSSSLIVLSCLSKNVQCSHIRPGRQCGEYFYCLSGPTLHELWYWRSMFIALPPDTEQT
ncbi:hypothetical protein FRC14_001672 [Serendipita sp. 396]|nr:hypothetical protein FRC14_001672 [Serendipita sp. 396]KAG8773060.1 hypothetical protein FRC15_002286 [Serendipita sp. 397]KAG8784688.1 hypothetical protein FRC16_002125 [Serendipita sp. 398]KAG8850170.1 hypothetical protein FRC20_002109 [Serendipita sp. 405]